MKQIDKDLLKELEIQTGGPVNIDDSKFEVREETEDDLASLETKSAGIEMPEEPTIEEKMAAVGISKDEVVEMILQLSDDGFIERDISFFGGKFKAKFKTSTLNDTKDFISMFDKLEASTQAKAEYYMNLYSLAAILNSYNEHETLSDDIIERAKWIENHIPVPIYKALLAEASKFHSSIEVLNEKEVASFF